MQTASRIAAQERAFAVREGLTRADDTLPKKLINYQMPGTWPEDKVDAQSLERYERRLLHRHGLGRGQPVSPTEDLSMRWV